jgi:catechol 2,3-dioxygenase-like lactoylglutathione lyase family enzyme
MTVQLAMVGVIVTDMARSLEFYRRLGLPIPQDEDAKRFVMYRMPSGVTIFFDEVFFPGADPERTRAPKGAYNIALEFYLGTREEVDATTTALADFGYTVRKAPWKSSGPYASIVEDPDGNAILLTAEDAAAELPG